MNGPELFVETLKRIGFPEAHKYKPDDFVSMFADKELAPILESFCTLTEDNVLSTEELASYAAIPPKELAHLEKLAQKSEAFATDISDEKNEELKFLEKHLTHIEEHNKSLQKQRELLKLRLTGILEEKDRNEKVLVNSKRKFESYSMQKVPEAQADLTSVLQTISKLISEIEKLITDTDYDTEAPSPQFVGAETYLEEEAHLLRYIEDLLGKNFQIEDFRNFTLNIPGHEDSEFIREVNLFQKALKKSKVEELKAACEKEKLNKIIEFYKKCEDVLPVNIFEIPTSELWSRLGEENDRNEKLIAKEKLINLYLSAAVTERMDAHSNKLAIAHSDEVVQIYNSHCKKIQGHLDEVISHKSRLQLVSLYLDEYARKFASIKQLTEQSSNFLEKEKDMLSRRKQNFQNDLEKESPKKDKYLPEDSVFISVFKILKDIDEDRQNLSSITMDDVFKKVEKVFKQKEFIEKLQNQKLTVLNSLETQRSAIEKVVFQGKEFAELSEIDMNLNMQLNKMGVTSTAMKKTVMDLQNYMDTKEKLLKNDRKLRLARYLYLYALCNEDKFQYYIEKIKTSAENCMDTHPNSS
ncbi:hypothetical protein JTE90_027969 [Oedothorax gibbosus]|uniref:Uncharacterized protein n=1 Tax=Oedothorax gibbosus TaxID=931172 RepID=A0AAV6VHS3_9ARAC|nr:hypothetical protein JTE90_027969 [Oedothorax gibbosus]